MSILFQNHQNRIPTPEMQFNHYFLINLWIIFGLTEEISKNQLNRWSFKVTIFEEILKIFEKILKEILEKFLKVIKTHLDLVKSIKKLFPSSNFLLQFLKKFWKSFWQSSKVIKITSNDLIFLFNHYFQKILCITYALTEGF